MIPISETSLCNGTPLEYLYSHKEAVLQAYRRVAHMGCVPEHFTDSVVLFLECPWEH